MHTKSYIRKLMLKDEVWHHAGRESLHCCGWFWWLNSFLLKDSFWRTMKGDKEGIVNQNCTCLTSLFLKLVISTLKTLGRKWSTKELSGGTGDGVLALQVANKCLHATRRRVGPGRALPSRNRQRLPVRERGRKMHGSDKASRCFTKKLPMDYKTPTTMTKTTKWR
jgi:hypothetical protein